MSITEDKTAYWDQIKTAYWDKIIEEPQISNSLSKNCFAEGCSVRFRIYFQRQCFVFVLFCFVFNAAKVLSSQHDCDWPPGDCHLPFIGLESLGLRNFG